MKKFTSVYDVDDPASLVAEALALKKTPFANQALGRNKTVILVFFNPSLRTRLSTELAAKNLGCNVMTLNVADGWKLEFADGTVMNGGTAEHIREAAGVMSQYADILAVRSFPGLEDKDKDYADEVMNAFVKYASVPVVSLESAIRHPLQSLADWVTIEEYKKQIRPKVVLTWAPHPRALPQAVSNSFLEWMQAAPVDLVLTHPEGYELDPAFVKNTPVAYSQKEAFAGADFVYAKNWSPLTPYGKPQPVAENWQVTKEKMDMTDNGYFMHCLPVRRNVVVSDAVLDSSQSLVLPQAGNRLYAAQAVLQRLLGGVD
ncbi:N-acetylornithine carbamoyltransferase [Lewinella cohaerens]|uniref:N-acetylornithine carbamoyltransferase n=1 Tax=Lewinella cohaerens TaxID=70995 RepID=UPI00037484D1|nr:N-acetylornithine carbamoyltransferase [Lewinella cohaerens]